MIQAVPMETNASATEHPEFRTPELAVRLAGAFLKVDADLVSLDEFLAGFVLESADVQQRLGDPRALNDAIDLLEEAGYLRFDETTGVVTLIRDRLAADMQAA